VTGAPSRSATGALREGVDALLARGNPRQGEVDEERDQVGLREPIDFQSELRPRGEP
jgi:hypothetical protein